MPRMKTKNRSEQCNGAKKTYSFVTARTWSTALCILDSQVKESRDEYIYIFNGARRMNIGTEENNDRFLTQIWSLGILIMLK